MLKLKVYRNDCIILDQSFKQSYKLLISLMRASHYRKVTRDYNNWSDLDSPRNGLSENCKHNKNTLYNCSYRTWPHKSTEHSRLSVW